jgi:signal transduction histidine kinase
MSFRARLVLAAAYLLTAVVLALEIPLALNVERRAETDFRSAVLGRAAVLAAQVEDLVAASGSNAEAAGRLRTIVGNAAERDERVIVTDGAGRALADSSGAAARGASLATSERPELEAALNGQVDFRRRFSETLGEDLLLVTVPIVEGSQVVGAVRVSARTGSVTARVHERWLRLALIGLAVIAAGLVLAWALASSLARPVRRLADAADRLGRGDLEARAETGGPAEIERLATSFNRMAATISATLAGQRDFIANASHQLRTPLTGIKLRLEALRGEGGRVGEQAASAEAELDRLSELVDDLLELTRASAGEPTGKTVDLASAARAAVDRWREPAEREGKRIALVRAEPAVAWTSETDVAHVFDNLIENSLRYTPQGTSISVEAWARDTLAGLAVADDGPGIPLGERPRVFERFYRGSAGRRAGSGTGLGLAIAAELVRRWSGEIVLVDGPGTRVEGRFPRAPTVS